MADHTAMDTSTVGLLEYLHQRLTLLGLATSGLRVPAAQRAALLETIGALRDDVGSHLALQGAAA
jgi:hypothetical protein